MTGRKLCVCVRERKKNRDREAERMTDERERFSSSPFCSSSCMDKVSASLEETQPARVTLLRKQRLCLSAGPDTGGSSSSLQTDGGGRERLKTLSFPKHTGWGGGMGGGRGRHTFWRLGHRRLQAVHVVSSVAVVAEEQLVLRGKKHRV